MNGYLITKVGRDQLITFQLGDTVIYLAVDKITAREVVLKIQAPKEVIISKPKADLAYQR